MAGDGLQPIELEVLGDQATAAVNTAAAGFKNLASQMTNTGSAGEQFLTMERRLAAEAYAHAQAMTAQTEKLREVEAELKRTQELASELGSELEEARGKTSGLGGAAAESTKSFGDYKREIRLTGVALQDATGVHIPFFNLLRSLNPATLALAAAAVTVGGAVKYWREESKKINDELKELNKGTEEEGKELEKLVQHHIALNPHQEAVIEHYQRLKQEKADEEWERQGKAISSASMRIDELNFAQNVLKGITFDTSTAFGRFANNLEAALAPALILVKPLLGWVERNLAKTKEHLNDLTNTQATGTDAGAKQDALALEAHKAAMKAKEKATIDALQGEEKIHAQFAARRAEMEERYAAIAGTAQYKELTTQLDNEEKAEVDSYSRREHARTVKHSEGWEARKAKEDEGWAKFEEAARERHEKILQHEDTFVNRWNEQARAARERATKEREREAEKELRDYERNQEMMQRANENYAKAKEALASHTERDIEGMLSKSHNKEAQMLAKGLAVFQKIQQIKTMVTAVNTARETMLKARAAAQGVQLTGREASAEIATNTPKAAQGAYSAMASIPYVGPFLGIAAAAAAMLYGQQKSSEASSAASSFQSAHSGLDRVPNTGTFVLQEGESVLKRDDAEKWPMLFEKIMSMGGGDGGTTHHHHYYGSVFKQDDFDRTVGEAVIRAQKNYGIGA